MSDTTGPRLSNLNRAEWRQKCRSALADHLRKTFDHWRTYTKREMLGSKLGLSIELSMIRLSPQPEDGYAWLRSADREHLFSKQLSKHSVGAYMELCREVGSSVEAILPAPSGPDTISSHSNVCPALISILPTALTFS